MKHKLFCIIFMMLICIPTAFSQSEYEYYMDNVQTITFDTDAEEVNTWTKQTETNSVFVKDGLLNIIPDKNLSVVGITQGISEGDKAVFTAKFRFNDISQRGVQFALFRPEFRAVVRINATDIEYRNGSSGFKSVSYDIEKDIWYTAKITVDIANKTTGRYHYSMELSKGDGEFVTVFEDADVQAFKSPRNYVSVIVEDSEYVSNVSIEKLEILNGHIAGSEYYFIETFPGQTQIPDTWEVKDEQKQLSLKDGVISFNMKRSLIARVKRYIAQRSDDMVLTFDARMEYTDPTAGAFIGIQLCDGEKRAFLQIMPDKFRIQKSDATMAVYNGFKSDSEAWYSYRVTRTGDVFKVERRAANEVNYQLIADEVVMRDFKADSSIAFYCEKIGGNGYIKNISLKAVFEEDENTYMPAYTEKYKAKTEASFDYADKQTISFKYTIRDDVEFYVYHNGKKGCVKLSNDQLTFTNGENEIVLPVESKQDSVYSGKIICTNDGRYAMERSENGVSNVIFQDAVLSADGEKENGYKVVRVTSSVSGITATGENLSDFYQVATFDEVTDEFGFSEEKDENLSFFGERMSISSTGNAGIKYSRKIPTDIPSYIMTFSLDTSYADMADYLSLSVEEGKLVFEKDRIVIYDSYGNKNEYDIISDNYFYRVENSLGYVKVFKKVTGGEYELLCDNLHIGQGNGELVVEKNGNIDLSEINITRTQKRDMIDVPNATYGYAEGLSLPEKCILKESDSYIFIGNYTLNDDGNANISVVTKVGSTEMLIEKEQITFTSGNSTKSIPLASEIGKEYSLRIEIGQGKYSLFRGEGNQLGMVFMDEATGASGNENSIEAAVTNGSLSKWIYSNGGLSAYNPEITEKDGQRYLKFSIIDSKNYLVPENKPIGYMVVVALYDGDKLKEVILGDANSPEVILEGNTDSFKAFVWSDLETMRPLSSSFIWEVIGNE